MQDDGIVRVCCLLPRDEQVYDSGYLLDAHREAFGAEHVCSAPIRNYHLVDRGTLNGTILPFLRQADAGREPVVVHCFAGIGRTGHVLAAWLTHARGYGIDAAIAAVKATGRDPREAITSGTATEAQLRQLLAPETEDRHGA